MKDIIIKKWFTILCNIAVACAGILSLNQRASAEGGPVKIADNVYACVDAKDG